MWSLVRCRRPWGRRNIVTINSSLFAVNVYDIGGVICVDFDERADGPALQLVLLLVVRRIDVATDADTLVTCIHIRVEVTLTALLSLLQGLYDGRNFLCQLGHELTLAR